MSEKPPAKGFPKAAVYVVLSSCQEISVSHQPSHQRMYCTPQPREWKLLYFVVFIGVIIQRGAEKLLLENTACLHRQSVSGLAMYNVLVTAYIAETRLAACSDRALIEHGKGSGRLQQTKSKRLVPENSYELT